MDLDAEIDNAIEQGEAMGPADATDVVADGVRVRNSEWLVTINTNQKYRNDVALKRGVRNFHKALVQTFSKQGNLEEIIVVNTGVEGSFQGDIGKIDSRIVIENARNGLHAHIHIKACHTTKLRVHLKNLRLMINTLLDPDAAIPKKVYINVQHVPNQSAQVRNYIYKQVRGKNIKMCDGEEFPDEVQISHTINIAALRIYEELKKK